MLGDRTGDSDNISFLEGIIANHVGRHLPGERHHGNGIHISRGNSGYQVGPPRTGSGNADPGLP